MSSAQVEKPVKAPRKRDRRYWMKFFTIYFLTAFVALYVIVPIALTYIVSHPRRLPIDGASPADFDLSYETVTFQSSDGVNLSGWYIPSQNGAAIIAVHANDGNRTGVLYHANVLAGHGYGVLLFDVRGFGESEGSTYPYPAGGMSEDVIGAAAYLQTRDDVDPDRIGAMGLSLGAIMVLRAAGVSDSIQAVWSDGADEATLADIEAQLPAPLYSAYIRPTWALTMWMWGVQGDVPGPLVSEHIADISPRPIFLIGAESTTEIEDNRMFYALAGEPKTLWELPDSGHIAGLFTHPDEYQQRMLAFFDAALLPAASQGE